MRKTKKIYQSYKTKNWIKRNWFETTTICIGLVAINLVFLTKIFPTVDTFDPTKAGQLGDFVGGYVGTVFALMSVIFLYSTFKNQLETSRIEKFENKYFEMVKMHRDNVAEIGIGESVGRKIFVILVREFREIFKIAKEIAYKQNQPFSRKDLFIISYYGLLFGVGPNSSRVLKQALKIYDHSFVNEFEKSLNNKETKELIKKNRGFQFTPFEGHQSRLGHYYRHLYQTICYVNKQKDDIDKYEYVKTIRAQLTTHEQVLLFINSLTPIGEVWWQEKLIVKYRLVKNIPSYFFDPYNEIDLASYFPLDYFEWQERKIG